MGWSSSTYADLVIVPIGPDGYVQMACRCGVPSAPGLWS